MSDIKRSQIQYLMLKRQNLIGRDDNVDYEKMFRTMSPVPTLFWTTPGEPPTIKHRFNIDDITLNGYNRANRTIIKGRFRGGSVGYIYADELPLFMSAYKKDISTFTEVDDIVLRTIKYEGAMNIHMIKEITGLLSKHIAASLQKLQKAFIMFEDQVDNEWDRAWYILDEEFEEIDLTKYSKEDALSEVVLRFAYLNVFFDESMVKSFTKFTNKDIKNTITKLLEEGKIVEAIVDERKGYIQKEDLDEVKKCTDSIPDDIYILDLNDHIVKSNEIELKERFNPKPFKTLHYIMKKGEIIGALTGAFRFGPYDLEDVIVDLPVEDMLSSKQRIIDEIEKKYDPHTTLLKRYCGESRVC